MNGFSEVEIRREFVGLQGAVTVTRK